MRGKRKKLLKFSAYTGITPAGAGKTNTQCGFVLASWDHPRRCGENFQPHQVAAFRTGSPPQVRGKRLYTPLLLFLSRITPAGAGKTSGDEPLALKYPDHPRRCGENSTPSAQKQHRPGSPPQVRGKHTNAFTARISTRITPAGAGKTRRFCLRKGCGEDHPRRCGENSQLCSPYFNAPGSPPQVRGKPTPLQSHAPLSGITPAGAGKTLKRSFRNQSFCS